MLPWPQLPDPSATPLAELCYRLSAVPELASRTLGSELAQLRSLRQQTLRTVAQAADISSAYLLKLERDDVQTPSPHVLQRLAMHFGVSYTSLMQLAGYRITDDGRPTPRPGVLADALMAEPLTEEEERAVAAFLTTLRSQARSTSA